MIQQPTLGELLVKLRKKKGWTQEELVEACHVSVRTIQRIESGEVTPRTSTINLLLEALDYDTEEWKEFAKKDESNHSPFKLFKTMFALDLPENQLKKSFHDAWIAGILFLLLFIVDAAMEFILAEDRLLIGEIAYVAIKVATMGAYLLFMRGFISLAILFENRVLRISSYLSIGTLALVYVSDITFMIFFPSLEEFEGIVGALAILTNGATALFYGVGLRRLQDGMGKSAKYAGIIEIIMGICLLTLIFSPFALILFAPAMILEIMILSKADELASKNLI
ncbi:helix-turn-helix domain-containing protein [Marinoscillum sp.]|uniref:helix-turn-helix domain-containing protein n=1 Tax=Marinoscillum sp. TaxID=2024838 RepID=UPI003BACEE59